MATLKELYDKGYSKARRKSNGKIAELIRADCTYEPSLNIFDAILDDWEPSEKKVKKTVTLYRYLIADKHGYHCLTDWSTKSNEGRVKNPNYRVLKIEEKEVEYEE